MQAGIARALTVCVWNCRPEVYERSARKRHPLGAGRSSDLNRTVKAGTDIKAAMHAGMACRS